MRVLCEYDKTCSFLINDHLFVNNCYNIYPVSYVTEWGPALDIQSLDIPNYLSWGVTWHDLPTAEEEVYSQDFWLDPDHADYLIYTIE